MTFEKLVQDLQSLTGQKLESIRPGADIILNEVNASQERIFVTSSSGVTKSRPLSELKIIWGKLHEQPAVHVDEALHGSGTSRNQPETIMANLAYIEWFKFNNKKHIAFVGKNTHSHGSKRQMDENNAELLREKLRGNTFDTLSMMIITNEIASVVQLYGNMTGITPVLLCPGVYIFNLSGKTIAFVSTDNVKNIIPEGTYSVINKPAGFSFSRQVQINEDWFCVKSINGLNMLIKL